MEHISPGPINPSLLNLQKDHVSTNIWNGGEVTFRAGCNFWQQLPSALVLEVIRTTIFGHILDISTIEINNHLITALVERWRSETHTFHLPIGECIVTLEDVTYQLGLSVNRAVITGITSANWEIICHNLLGAILTDKQIMGQRIQMSWLDSTFIVIPEGAGDFVIEQHARAFILRMIGGFLVSDTSGSRVHLMYLPLLEDLSQTYQYSWGSDVLACLYRGLCCAALISRQIEIGGCLHLLQSWAYDRIPMLAPRLHDALARMSLICFALVEWHVADRVMRQFGLQQLIPEDPINMEKQHKMDLREKK
ncbi:PREDICTED: serine/threonine-protein phosphatase 7 long form homolog [Lupinus angustifolius]|uniref:serine/threonine-protein phosphatase 7 long form homolog n=1 Tax=Lupinus angustifolius TaxID=3871 RepID=UPI00092FA8F3|nr:PREDICTED: serine/threonine-protein phosphatase 7 long form homolog [Lupinus angustifolius]